MYLQETKKERPEVAWLRNVYENFCVQNGGIRKSEADSLIYRRMYAKAPEKPSDVLKIRYWRTGHHVPANREQCLAFGKAMDLSEQEKKYLLLQYFDRNDRIFSESSKEEPEYIRRKKLMDVYLREYLVKIYPGNWEKLKITSKNIMNNIRHIYFCDALKYIHHSELEEGQFRESHSSSVNYGSELNRNLHLLGEIPRRTMIRHILILGIPYINLEILNERLELFGYLPLEDCHTLLGGEYLDWLLIRLMRLYEESCSGMSPEACTEWFQSASRILDGGFAEHHNENLRFMFFKALKGGTEENGRIMV